MADFTQESGFETGLLQECLKSMDTYLKKFAIVWLVDSSPINNELQLSTINNQLRLCIGLQKTQQHVYQCYNIGTCIKQLKKLIGRNVILLISVNEALSDEQKSTLRSFSHVECIYQFGSEDPCIKLTEVFNIDNKLSQNVSCLSDISPDARNTLLEDLDHETKVFALKQVLIELLQQTSYTPKEKENFIHFCLTKCFDENDRENIRKYENTDFEKKAIWCYTTGTIIPCTINRTLREENLNCLIKIHYFIRKLYAELDELYQLELSKFKSGIQLYRGKVLSCDELNHLQRSEGEFVVTNSFVSTSTDEREALAFSGDGNTELEDKVLVIFSINLHVRDNIAKPVAFISQYSQKQDNEQAVLLCAGIILRIVSVRKKNDNIWKVELVRDAEEEKFEGELYENFRTQIKSVLDLASFLKDMDDDRYFSEYCDLMSNLLDQQDPQTADRLQTLALNDGSSSKSVPQPNDSLPASTPESMTHDDGTSSQLHGHVTVSFGQRSYCFKTIIIILAIAIIISVILIIILPIVILKQNEKTTRSVTYFTDFPLLTTTISTTTTTTVPTNTTTKYGNAATSCVSMNDLFFTSCCTFISIFFNINGNFVY